MFVVQRMDGDGKLAGAYGFCQTWSRKRHSIAPRLHVGHDSERQVVEPSM